jgi:hypothetical protein
MKVHGNIVRIGSSGKRGTAFLFKKGEHPGLKYDILDRTN